MTEKHAQRGRQLQSRWFALTVALLAASPVLPKQLVLEQALTIAFDRSPTMQDARHNLEINRHNLQAQRAALKSRFGLSVTPYEFAKDRVVN